MSVCAPGSAAELITRYLGFDCSAADPVVTLRNPAQLANWTLPVLECTIILGAVLALLHAMRRWRRDGDPTNLAIWLASLLYLFVIEPPLYFPQWFGLQHSVGFMFSHNVFSVQFMYDRLPLYIVAFYPAVSQLAYEIVRALGVFARRGPLAGAVCTALVYQAFYEIFDQLGPQMKWWAWNVDEPFFGGTASDLGNKANSSMLASVPMNSIWLFASVSFGVLIYLAVRLIGVSSAAGVPPRGFSLGWRIVVTGVCAPIGMVVFSIPTAIFGQGTPNVTAQTIVLTTELAAFWVIGLAVLARHLRDPQRTSGVDPRSAMPFIVVFGALYLVVFAVLWISALPAYLDAVDGVTAAGTPTGSLAYAIACFVLAVAALGAAAVTAARAGRVDRPELVGFSTPRS
ncbi:hypothetical protein [Gordonia polyisoprenivorans]|uniref:hypothetical protein n=1 Tax=Gordonia polyisoprenivorans TaxID=84595 RepID=UPI0023003FB7|nr:hypothetical protein [Gordonia polyisoprenivorans]WCB36834.1 hypothetical protein PHA63_22720 [Gordonia polyisoprenivorans]